MLQLITVVYYDFVFFDNFIPMCGEAQELLFAICGDKDR